MKQWMIEYTQLAKNSKIEACKGNRRPYKLSTSQCNTGQLRAVCMRGQAVGWLGQLGAVTIAQHSLQVNGKEMKIS